MFHMVRKMVFSGFASMAVKYSLLGYSVFYLGCVKKILHQ